MIDTATILLVLNELFTPTVYSFGAAILLFLILLVFMRPRRFYLVRHGETLSNAQHIRQGESGALSERGRAQALLVGQYLQKFPIKQILGSPYPRAKETAEIINSFLKVPVSFSVIFAERRNPSEIIGKPTHDPEVVRIVDQMDLAYHDDKYRFSDEENFLDERTRAKKCLNLLASQSARESVIVTHHHFLKMLIAYLLYRDRLHAADYVKLAFFNTSDNAGITIVEYHPWKMFSPTHGWQVISFNEKLEK